MSKSKIHFTLIVLLDIVSILVVYGSFLEIKGFIAYFIFAVPVVLNILLLIMYGNLFKQLLTALFIFVYLVTGAVVLIREDGRKIVRQNKNGRNVSVVYEINPGAMGHLSYLQRDYYSLIDIDLFMVRVVKNSEHYRYIG